MAAFGRGEREVEGAGEDGAAVIRDDHDGGTRHDRARSLWIRDGVTTSSRSIAHFLRDGELGWRCGLPFPAIFSASQVAVPSLFVALDHQQSPF